MGQPQGDSELLHDGHPLVYFRTSLESLQRHLHGRLHANTLRIPTIQLSA